MTNYVVLLGTKGGPAIRPGSTMPTSSLLVMDGQKIVVDCGLGVSRGLVDHGVQLKDISLVFITHLHSDHYIELGPMLHTAWTAGLETPVAIWGPAGLDVYWDGFLASMKADIDLRIEDEGRPDLRALVSIQVIDDENVMEEGGLKVLSMRNIHPPLINTFALSFENLGKRVVFSGDTAYMPKLADFANGADLLIHEAMLEEALSPLVARVGNGDGRLMKHLLCSHTMASDAAKIANDAGVKALVLNHLIPSDDPDFTQKDWHDAIKPHWSGTFHQGKDGLQIVF